LSALLGAAFLFDEHGDVLLEPYSPRTQTGKVKV
jgi:hypothetical protein